MNPVIKLKTSPVEILKEEFGYKTLKDVDDAMRFCRGTLELVLMGNAVTPRSAYLLAWLTNTTPEFWLNLQKGKNDE